MTLLTAGKMRLAVTAGLGLILLLNAKETLRAVPALMVTMTHFTLYLSALSLLAVCSLRSDGCTWFIRNKVRIFPGPTLSRVTEDMISDILDSLDVISSSKTFPAANVHSLCYNFTITYLRFGQQQCEVQGQVDKKIFLYYDCTNNKVRPHGSLGKEISTSKTWDEQIETLRDVKDMLKQQWTDILTIKFPLSLQSSMTCQREGNGITHGFWQFGFNGQTDLLFDAEKQHWTVHPGGRLMKERWENDRDVTKFFEKISMGDCKRWLDNFLVLWGEELEARESLNAAPTTGTYFITVTNGTSYGIGTYITYIIMSNLVFAFALAFIIGVFYVAVTCRSDIISAKKVVK